ncbi:hypothetical protein ACP_1334 [Acidobacterium capsulatum ATCC 51196]|uniref:Uncharacterized protein n=1 Tax=Acidobacterium capsulatum (strain ATCC 51196 / DSM 11244 / BCRC 80197 / JCM 7670 / NBRC 15755 / NCIMB 13165 / 161) TaxID=240015 RepID=C1F5G0_ACIC5|nr:hypothetical protein ACP_1334 [Acidobacterium capsulatum ATCC 51196]
MPALRREPFEGLIAGEDALALRGRDAIQLAQTVHDALLLRGIEPVEAGLAAQRLLLL